MTRANKKPWVIAKRLHQNLDTQQFYVELEYTRITGARGRLRVPRLQMDDPRGAKRDLASLGSAIPDEWLEELKAALASTALPIVQTTTTNGWHGDAYVCSHTILGHRGNIRPLYPEQKSEAVGGTAKAWKKGLAPICAKSSFLTFAIAVAFAGPLVRKLGFDEGAIFHLYAETSTGKSTALMAAQSVYERTGRDRLRTFDMTPRALEEGAAACNDGLFVVDEAGRIEAEGQGRKKRFSDLAFVIASGKGRLRSEKATADASLRNLRFLVMGLSTGEDPIDGKGEAARRGGEQVRLISVPIPELEQRGIFDLEPEDTMRAALLAATQQVVNGNHGVALKPFINGLLTDDQAIKRAHKRVDRFVRWAMPRPNPFGERFARKFAVVYAAAVLAVDFGIAPWSKRHAGDAIQEVFKVAWAEVRPAEAEADDFARELLSKAEDDQHFPVVEKGEVFPSAAAEEAWGIRRTIKGRVTLAVFRKEFHDLVSAPDQEVLDILAVRGWMLPGREQRLYVNQLRIKGRPAARTDVLMFDLETLRTAMSEEAPIAAE